MSIKTDYFNQQKGNLEIQNAKDRNAIAQIGYALGHPIRVEILNQLQEKPLSIPVLAKLNDISITNCVFHVEILENAGLIEVQISPSAKKKVRICHKYAKELAINFARNELVNTTKEIEHKMITRIGEFVDISDDSDVGFATTEKAYFADNHNIYRRERYDADLLVKKSGTVTYAFPNKYAINAYVSELNIKLEICSEALFHNNNYKSDITFWINDVELFTYTCPGDYGDRKGYLNPEWYTKDKILSSQYGDLLNITIKDDKVYLNEIIVNENLNIQSLNLGYGNKTTLKIGNKKNAKYVGGFNIYGKNFGDYPIDIELTAKTYNKKD